jgi:hypothetical protein
VKKHKTQDQEQKRKTHRLILNRETIRVLNDPALLAGVRGGHGTTQFSAVDSCDTTTASDTGC